MSNRPHAIILGLGGSNALGVTRGLGEQDIPCVGFHISGRIPHAADSRYIHHSFEVANESALLERLTEFGKKQRERSVLFPTGDDYLIFCATHADSLMPFYHLPFPSDSDVITTIDKETNLELGRRAGFQTPNSSLLEDLTAGSSLAPPVIVKPLTSVGSNKTDMHVYHDLEALMAERAFLLERYGNMSVQEFVPGNHETLLGIRVYNGTNGPFIVGMHRPVLSLDKSSGAYVSVIIEDVWDESVVAPSLRLAELVGPGIPLDIDLKQSSADETYHFLEVNLRTSANVALDTAHGTNLPTIVYRNRIGLDYNDLIHTQRVSGMRWAHEGRLSECVMKYGLPRVLSELHNVNTYVFHNTADPEPFKKQEFSTQLDPAVLALILD